jgi:hypothetical protein
MFSLLITSASINRFSKIQRGAQKIMPHFIHRYIAVHINFSIVFLTLRPKNRH